MPAKPKLPKKDLSLPLSAEHIRRSVYTTPQGKAVPLLEFGEYGDRFPFSFGGGKAKRFLAAVEEVGLETVIHAIQQLANGA